MFEASEESTVLDIVGAFFEVSEEDMMSIGDMTKKLLFDPGVDSKEEAVKRFSEALQDKPREHALIAGVFLSGLLRCNLAQQMQQQMQEMAEGCQAAEDNQKPE